MGRSQLTGVFLQARMGSARLPGKALALIGDLPVVAHAMRALRRLPVSVHALLTDTESEGSLEPVASQCGFSVFTGSADDVLDRYDCAASHYGVTEIVRATGDNPLVSASLARMAVARRRELNADYFAFDGAPLGTGVEIVLAAAIARANRESQSTYDHEHVCPYLYRSDAMFRSFREVVPPAFEFPDARVTIDTREDLERVRQLFADLYDGAPVECLPLVKFLKGNGARH